MHERRFLFSLALLVLPGAALANAGGNPVRGAEVYRECSSCHEVGTGAGHRVGPHRNGIFDCAAGASANFRYSDGLKRAAAEGLNWDYESLGAFIENPSHPVIGTFLPHPVMHEKQDRDDVLAYRRQLSASPRDIPEAAPTGAARDYSVDSEIFAIAGDPAYGEYLSGECTSCHQIRGVSSGVPSITAWPEEDFVIALNAYKDGKREHPVMQMVAARLSDEEIAALAAYFAGIKN